MSRGRIIGLGMILLALMVTGCAAPQFTYVTNSGAHTYFKVPSGWRQISDSSLQKAINNGGKQPSTVWSVGYDASSRPAAEDALSSANLQPFAYSVVAPVNQTTTNSLSYNELRDFFLPVTATARTTATQGRVPAHQFPPAARHDAHPRAGRARSPGDVRVRLPGWQRQYVRPGRSDECG